MDGHILAVTLWILWVGQSSTVEITNPMNGHGTAANVIPENSVSGTVGKLATITDASVPLLFVLVKQTVPGCFEIPDPTTGVVTVSSTAVLDYETDPSHYLTFAAQAGINFTLGTLIIKLKDVNDNPPYFNPDIADRVVYIADRSPQGTLLVHVNVSDDDGTRDNNRISEYKIIAGNRGSTFVINNDGEIRVAAGKKVNKSQIRLYDLIVTATDNGTPPLTGSAIIRVNVGNGPGNCGSSSRTMVWKAAVVVLILCAAIL